MFTPLQFSLLLKILKLKLLLLLHILRKLSFFKNKTVIIFKMFYGIVIQSSIAEEGKTKMGISLKWNPIDYKHPGMYNVSTLTSLISGDWNHCLQIRINM